MRERWINYEIMA